jgi:hypothetical protein
MGGQPAYADKAAFVANRVVVARLPLPLAWRSAQARFDVHVLEATVVLELSQDLGRIDRGVIAGTATALDVVGAFDRIGSQAGVCATNTVFAGAREVVLRAPDIRQDGKLDPALACDGISVGAELTGSRAVKGATVAPQPQPPGTCGDGG